jgi:hypothetical protein
MPVDIDALVKRRHPDYAEMLPHWEFCELAYRGGRAWFEAGHVFKFYKEGETEYKGRVERTYRANHIKRVVSTVNEFLFKQPAKREDNKVNGTVKTFWKEATREGRSIDSFAAEVDKWQSVYGVIYVVMDRTAERVDNVVQEKNPYTYWLPPQKILDFATDENGAFEWILIEEDYRDEKNPFTSSGICECRYRLWTKTEWHLYAKNPEAKKDGPQFMEIANDMHGLGFVPVLQVCEPESKKYSGPGLIDDAVYMDRALVNYGSLLDEILYEQTFSQLTMPAEAVLPGSADATALIAAAKNRIFLYNATSPGAKPEYISPDASQARTLMDAMKDLMATIYASTGTDYEASSQSMSTGKSYASGKVRQFDFMGIENLLAKKAKMLESMEEKLAEMAMGWMGTGKEFNKSAISYPTKFDIRGLAAELDIAAQTNELNPPAIIMQMHMKAIADKMFPRMSSAEREKVYKEIDAWTPPLIVEQDQTERQVAVKETQTEIQQQDADTREESAAAQAKAAMKAASKPAPKPAA